MGKIEEWNGECVVERSETQRQDGNSCGGWEWGEHVAEWSQPGSLKVEQTQPLTEQAAQPQDHPGSEQGQDV